MQVVLDRYHNGPKSGMALEALSMMEVDKSSSPEYFSLLSVEPLIISDELHLRVQHWFTFDEGKTSAQKACYRLVLCNHLVSGVV